jgi:uncharacterized protein YkwD
MVVRRTTVVLAVMLLAALAAIGVLALEPQRAGAAPAATVRTCDGGVIEFTADEERVLRLHNQTRVSYGLTPLCVHPALTEAARVHSTAMVQQGYMWHGPVGARLWNHGYHWRTYGENIASGSGPYAPRRAPSTAGCTAPPTGPTSSTGASKRSA